MFDVYVCMCVLFIPCASVCVCVYVCMCVLRWHFCLPTAVSVRRQLICMRPDGLCLHIYAYVYQVG